MSLILDNAGKIFSPYSYQKEKEFEAVVVELSDQIFGPSTLYIDVKKRVGNDIVTIPDGYLIDVTEVDAPKLFIIENEIVSHDPFKHIGIQMLKFVTSFDDSRREIRNFIMDDIQKNKNKLSRLNTACKLSESRNIDNYLDLAVYSDFRGLVVIDEAKPELYRVLEKINANISVLELQSFIAESREMIHQFDTLYEEFEEIDIKSSKSKRKTTEERDARRKRKAESDTIIVPAREDGFKEVFLGEDRWYAIRIGAAMKERIKYIAAYQVAPISAVTHIAEVQEIRPYKDSGKYMVIFKGAAKEIKPIKTKNRNKSPQGPIYVKNEKLLSVKSLEEAFL
jgi:hypothetical protein